VEIEEFWSSFFGLDRSVWSQRGLVVTKHVHLGNYHGIWFFKRGERFVVSAPEAWVDRLRQLTANLEPDSLLDEATLRSLLGEDFESCIGPAFRGYLEPGHFTKFSDPSVRVLSETDRPMVEAIAAESERTGWNPLQKGTLFQHASIEGERITALSGYRGWTDQVGDPCIYVDEDYRRRGLGTAVASAVVEHALSLGKTLIYQTLESNLGSVRIALRLGYRKDSIGMSVRLRRG
jgi:GNAT superfamily N-acetyltransferase